MFSIAITLFGIAALFFVGNKTKAIFPKSFFKYQITYQSITLVIALILVQLNRSQVDKHIKLVGNWSAPITNMKWLGIPRDTPWSSGAITYTLIPLFITSFVVYLQVAKSTSILRLLRYVPIAIPFAVLNSLTEELVFRVIGVEGLTYSVGVVAFICGVWFGIPHYFGTPGKIPGVLLAGFLGWVMAISMLNTGGLLAAWLIHFSQDIPILAMLFAINSQADPNTQVMIEP